MSFDVIIAFKGTKDVVLQGSRTEAQAAYDHYCLYGSGLVVPFDPDITYEDYEIIGLRVTDASALWSWWYDSN